jgi:hypothetical protein
VLIVDQRDQKVFEGRVLVPAAAGFTQRVMEGLFELASETGHLDGHSCVRLNGTDMVNNVIRTGTAIKVPT